MCQGVSRAGVELAARERLAEGLLERPPDPHRLPHALHLRAERRVCAGELLEGEARELDDHVVERRLEARRRRPREVVRDLVERVADRELRGHLRDRIAGRLGGERGRPRDARVHLDHAQVAGLAAARELDVGAAGLDTHGADDGGSGVAELLVGLVRQGHLRGDGDGVAGVDAHRVEVLDRADDDDVVAPVADHLELELVPAADALLDEYLADRALPEAELDLGAQLERRRDEAAAMAAERERGTHDGRQGDPGQPVSARDDLRARHLQAAALHRLAEELAVLGPPDHRHRGSEELDAERGQDSLVRELDGEVERGLPAERGQQRVGPLAAEHAGHALEVERLEVGAVGKARVGHDRRRVRVDDDRAVAVLAQHLERLAAGVVELAGLSDHDRPGADHADRAEVMSTRHRRRPSTQRSRIGQASCGPGPASGWNWTERARSSGNSSPSTVPS